jgi:hypothetical protein
MEEREFIVGLPYQRETGYLVNVVIRNRTTIHSFESQGEARYYADLLDTLHKIGIVTG